MAFQYLTNVPLAQAQKEYLKLLKRNGMRPKRESVPVQESCDRITAEGIYAAISAPHYNASAMDGIAVKAGLTFGASETTPVVLKPEEYTVIDTGDPLPDDCDAVIMIEDIVKMEDESVKLFAAAAPWQHIRQIGEDICAGEMILAAHMPITPAAIGAMLAAGVLEIPVLKKPVIGIVPTGNEIILPTADPKSGDIMEFNSSIFSAMLKKWGAESVTYSIVKDDFEEIYKSVEKAASECDMVILNAGSSAGREDYSASVIEKLGGVLYHGIAIKPGKPAILGYKEEKPILGVPGYPVSGIIVIEQILKPLIAYCLGEKQEQKDSADAVLSRSIVSGLKYQEFIRVRMGKVADKLIASPLNRGSGVVSSFMKADGILEIPQGTEGYEAGTEVSVKLLRPLQELERTLVVIGSHDPLLDEVANFLHLSDSKLYMSSSHVGSMGGIMAVRRGETHMAGIHLLDEKEGSYNTSFIKKYFPNGGASLIECVGRSQGLMLAKGNPRGIASVRDLIGEGLRYVNRQKGSGTRILLDYLLEKENIHPENIYGYEREEFTHTSVATQIAAGTADAGLGIYSAAKLYDLDFLPICIEQYDLLIPDFAWETPMVQKILLILQSEAFKSKLEELGGYEIGQPGRIREL